MRSFLGFVVVVLSLDSFGCAPKRSVEGVFVNPKYGKLTFKRRGEVVYQHQDFTVPGSIDEHGTYSLFIVWAKPESTVPHANEVALALDGGSVVKNVYLNSTGEGRVRVTVQGDAATTGGGVVFNRQR